MTPSTMVAIRAGLTASQLEGKGVDEHGIGDWTFTLNELTFQLKSPH